MQSHINSSRHSCPPWPSAPQNLHSTYLLALLTGPCSLLEVPPGRTRRLFLRWLRRMLFFSFCSLQKPAAPFLHDFWRLWSPYKKTALSCDFRRLGKSTPHSLAWSPQQLKITWELVFSRIIVRCWCTLVCHPKHHGIHLWHTCHRFAQQNPEQRSMHFFPPFLTQNHSRIKSVFCLLQFLLTVVSPSRKGRLRNRLNKGFWHAPLLF